MSLAKEASACLTLLHVLEWPWHEPPQPRLDELPPEQAFALATFRREEETRARKQLESIVPQARSRIRVDVVSGTPYEQVLAAADRDKADLIVLGVGRRSALNLALLGSTANHVVRAAACPVLTLRDRDGTVLWMQDAVAFKAGLSDSEEARQKLLDYRDRNGESVTLTMTGSGYTPPPLTFTLLTSQAQQDLKRDLAVWNNEAPLLRSLGRACVYTARLMYYEAAQEYDRAVALAPGDAETHYALATYLTALGWHDEAIASIERARELDPASMAVASDYSWFLYIARRYDDAIRQARDTLKLLDMTQGSLPAVAQYGRSWSYWVLVHGSLKKGDEQAWRPDTNSESRPGEAARAGVFWGSTEPLPRPNSRAEAAAVEQIHFDIGYRRIGRRVREDVVFCPNTFSGRPDGTPTKTALR